MTEGENDEKTEIPPEATDHPVLHVMVSNKASQAFTKPCWCVLVPRATLGTGAGKYTQMGDNPWDQLNPKWNALRSGSLKYPKGGQK